MPRRDLTGLSKFLSLIPRHEPGKFGIVLRSRQGRRSRAGAFHPLSGNDNGRLLRPPAVR
jgi:hypothetical protein